MDTVPESVTGLFLQQEYLLLALHPENGQFRGQHQSYACAGALLMELALHGRISTEGKKVAVGSTEPFSDPVLDATLDRISRAKRPRSLKNWVASLGGRTKLTHEIARTLETRGLVRAERKRFLGLIPYTSYPSLDPGVRERLREHLRQAVLGDTIPPVRLSTLAALAHSTGLLRQLFDRQERSVVTRRLKQWKKDDTYARAVGETIAGVQAAVLASVAVTAAAASGSSGSG